MSVRVNVPQLRVTAQRWRCSRLDRDELGALLDAVEALRNFHRYVRADDPEGYERLVSIEAGRVLSRFDFGEEAL